MTKPRVLLLIMIILTIMAIISACTNVPETQVYIVVTATPSLMPTGEVTEAVLDPAMTMTTTPLDMPAATPTTGVFPTVFATEIQVAEQVFQHGRMFWLQPNREIWVMINDPGAEDRGQWLIFEDTFEEGQPEYDPSITPPVDGLQPERGFGLLWREHTELREALGWGTTPEFGFITSYRYEPGGYLDSQGNYVTGPGVHVLTSLGNENFAFEEATQTWRRIE